MKHTPALIVLVCFLAFVIVSAGRFAAQVTGDVNGDGSVNALDVQLTINGALGIDIGGRDADINADGTVNALDVQLCINAALGITNGGNGGGDGDLPPDPVDVASTIDPTVPTDIADATEFIYTGDDPIQTGVAPGTIEARRVAILRGKVTTREGDPLSGVQITILNHPELGQTLTREDGMFDMAVNAGGWLTISYEKEDYLPAQRQVYAPWREYAWLPEVALIQVDSKVTHIDFSEPMQVARGSIVTDEDGTRQMTLFFPQGANAKTVMRNGIKKAASSLSVRATEYSVGSNGPNAMPAELPPTSGYTYCVEFSADEAIGGGAKSVEFDEPVIAYVENWLQAEVGSPVPLGYYDRDKAAWVPSDSGRVVEVMAITGGLAELDTDGDGVADDAGTLAGLGVTDAERQRVATLYNEGQSLWRMPIPHFSPWDANWAMAPPPDGVFPDQGPPWENDPRKAPCTEEGSIIHAQNQILGEAVPVAGTDFMLHYESDRVPGFTANRALDIPLTSADPPESLIGVEVRITVAGRQFTYSLTTDNVCRSQPPSLAPALVVGKTTTVAAESGPPAGDAQSVSVDDLSSQIYTFIWDGEDAYGRRLSGRHPVTVRVGYVYCGVYQRTDRFGYSMGDLIEGSRSRQEITLWQEWNLDFDLWDTDWHAIAGWSLSDHHTYDPSGMVLHRGDGGRRSAADTSLTVTTVAGTGWSTTSEDGVEAANNPIKGPADLVVGPDGSIYFPQTGTAGGSMIRRITPDGFYDTVAHIPDVLGHLAAMGPDGSLYVGGWDQTFRLAPNGSFTSIAGRAPQGYSGDGGPATEAQMQQAFDLAVAPDGTLYIADQVNSRIRMVTPDGIITTMAGFGNIWRTECFYYRDRCGDGGPAVEAGLRDPRTVALGPDGTVYTGEAGRVRRVGTDGIITTVAGNTTCNNESMADAHGLPATEVGLCGRLNLVVARDGTLYLLEGRFGRIMRIDADGIIHVIAGEAGSGFGGDNGPVQLAQFSGPTDIALGPDGSIYVAETGRIRRISSAFPDISEESYVIPDETGTEIYVFDSAGRHLQTLAAYTGAVLNEFVYDTEGRLTSITDASDNVTAIERNAAGDPTAVVSPYGQRTDLTVNEEGYLAHITDPAGNTIDLTYVNGGLLETFTDSNGGTYRFAYDMQGRLVSDEDPEGGWKTLTHMHMENGYQVEVETAEGRTRTYQVENLPSGDTRQVIAACCGTEVETVLGEDSSETVTLADGTVIARELGPDPRWGVQAPVLATLIADTPGGLSYVHSGTRTAELDEPGEPLSLLTETDTWSVNGRTYTSVYDAATGTTTSTSPEERLDAVTVDDWGRVVREHVDGYHPVDYAYDSHGRLASVSQGTSTDTRTVSFNYNSDGYLTGTTDPLGRTTTLSVDAVGQVTALLLPNGEQIQLTFDANGNVTTVTPPGRPAHTFTFTGVGLIASYEPPTVAEPAAQTIFEYDADRFLTRLTDPDGRTMDAVYDAEDRLVEVDLSRGQIAYTYDTDTGQLMSASDPTGVTLSYNHDGAWLVGEAWSGAISGTVDYTLNNDLLPAMVAINGTSTVDFLYDNDEFPIQAGELILTRDERNGAVTGMELGSVTETLSYNGFGEPTSRTVTYDGTTIFAVEQTYDMLGRVVSKSETIGEQADTYEFTYDIVDRLTEVRRNGTAVETYTYDRNGNRTVYTGPSGSVDATYDARDRVIQYGDTTYTYAGGGELVSTVTSGQTTTYDYDILGNLLQVDLPDGTVINYLWDAEGRLVGKEMNGTLDKGFLYWDEINPIAELDATGTLVSMFVYTTRSNVPDYMVKDGTVYRIVADYVGSPRVVVDVVNGQVAQRMDYDAFGNVVADTNPGFQPFGFAGGLYDRDTKLTRFGARDYDARTGRWTAPDPILFEAGQENLYVYVGNDPVNWIDPFGLGQKTLADMAREQAQRLRDINVQRDATKAAEDAAKASGEQKPPTQKPKPKPRPRPKPRPKSRNPFRNKILKDFLDMAKDVGRGRCMPMVMIPVCKYKPSLCRPSMRYRDVPRYPPPGRRHEWTR